MTLTEIVTLILRVKMTLTQGRTGSLPGGDPSGDPENDPESKGQSQMSG